MALYAVMMEDEDLRKSPYFEPDPKKSRAHTVCATLDDNKKACIQMFLHSQRYRLYPFEVAEVPSVSENRFRKLAHAMSGLGVREIRRNSEDERALYERKHGKVEPKAEAKPAPIPSSKVLMRLNAEDLQEIAEFAGVKVADDAEKATYIAALEAARG